MSSLSGSAADHGDAGRNDSDAAIVIDGAAASRRAYAGAREGAEDAGRDACDRGAAGPSIDHLVAARGHGRVHDVDVLLVPRRPRAHRAVRGGEAGSAGGGRWAGVGGGAREGGRPQDPLQDERLARGPGGGRPPPSRGRASRPRRPRRRGPAARARRRQAAEDQARAAGWREALPRPAGGGGRPPAAGVGVPARLVVDGHHHGGPALGRDEGGCTGRAMPIGKIGSGPSESNDGGGGGGTTGK